MIRVAVDAQIADVSRAGIGQFTSDLLTWLPLVDAELTVIPLRPEGRTKDFSMLERLWWDQVSIPRLARRVQADVILKPAFSVPIWPSLPTLVVLHDLAARRFPEQLHRPSAWYYGRFVPWTLRRANRIFTISQFTKQEAVELLGFSSERFVSIQPGGDPLASPTLEPSDDAVVKKFQLPEKFVLHIGTIEPRKNLAFLVRAFSKMLDTFPDYYLLLAGREGWLSGDLHQAVKESGRADQIRFVGPVSDQEKRTLMRRARVLAFPSTYEGFGLPPLEAMRSGTPVVASRTSSIPEVVGDAGILVEGYDEQAWASSLAAAAEDENVRVRLQAAGLKQAAMFSWETTGRTIAKTIHEATNGRSNS